MISLVVEGISDAAVVRRICRHIGVPIGPEHITGGKARLNARLPGYNNAARFAPWLVIRDLDHDADCAPSLIAKLLPALAPQMILRVPVRSVESWLIADRERFADYFGLSLAAVPADTDALDRPKRTVVDLSRHSRKRVIRDGVVPGPGHSVEVGPEYTSHIIEFATSHWSPEAAADSSESLARCIAAIRNAHLPGFGSPTSGD